jgi:polysaccharide export outer membrane protein
MGRTTAVLAVIAGTMSCKVLPAPVVPGDDPAFSTPEQTEPRGISNDSPNGLRLVPGDVVTLRTVSAETNEFEGLVVDELGRLHVPLAGDIDVGGLDLDEAEQRVETALRRYDRVLRANLIIAEAQGHRATVLGAVAQPGVFDVAPGTRLADLFAQAGGPLRQVTDTAAVDLADLHGARLVRQGIAVPVSLARAVEGNPRHNVYIRPGDHLYVPPMSGRRIRVLGDVNQASVVPFQHGLRLTEALAMAGGVSHTGSYRDIRVIRGSLREPRVYRVSLRDLTAGRGHDVELAPGDIVFVTRRGLVTFNEVMQALSPLLTTGANAGLGTAVILSN